MTIVDIVMYIGVGWVHDGGMTYSRCGAIADGNDCVYVIVERMVVCESHDTYVDDRK